MPANRIDLVDALRGYALLGLFLVHCAERFELYWLHPAPDLWFSDVMALFAGKAFAIFALLFGFSFATIMANERARGRDFTLRFIWRLALLFGLGTLHALIYRGDILQVLAVVGLLMIPFDRIRSGRALLVVAGLMLLQIPLLVRAWLAWSGWFSAEPFFLRDTSLGTLATSTLGNVLRANAGPGIGEKWSYYLETGRVLEVAALFLVGMVLQRRGLFANAKEKRATWLAIALTGAALWAAVRLVEPLILPGPEGAILLQRQALEWLTGQWHALSEVAVEISLFVLAWDSPLRPALMTLVPPGRMTLTLYVGQSLVAVPLLYGFGLGLWSHLSNMQAVVLGLGAFALQIAGAALWFRHFRYGPLEWLWRAATRTDFSLPIRA